MSVLSKIFAGYFGTPILHATCYETIHTWNPDCTMAMVNATPHAFLFSLRTYGVFYLLSALVRKGDPRKIDYKRLIKDILRSSIFLTSNMIFLLFSLCFLRRTMGFYIWPTVSFVNSIAASFFALLIENPTRRPMLALYLTNLASETLFRQLVNHGYLRSYKNGEAIVFAIGLAIITYMYKRYGEKAGAMGKLIKTTHCLDNSNADIIDVNKLNSNSKLWFSILRNSFNKHPLCEHKHSCASVAVESGLRNFTYGLGASLALAVLKSLATPRKLLRNVFTVGILRLPCFAGALPFIYHVVECTLTRHLNAHTELIPALAALVSGLAMLVYPSISVAMYVLWKAIEMIYHKLVEKNLALNFRHGDLLLYALSTGFVLGNVIIEPHAVRKGYINFLSGLTGNKLAVFNRRLFTPFGFDSSRVYDFMPKLNPRFATINPDLYLPMSRPF
uniref:TMEM135_C_rich domain-containing protein n=1 Tax=Panagrellus redivivus TaxID=6233 RepID=A0A7E4W0P4_PANRE